MNERNDKHSDKVEDRPSAAFADELIAYAAIFVFCLVGFGYVLARKGELSLYMLCGPALFIALLSFYFRIFPAIVVPCFVLIGLVMYDLFSRSSLVLGWQAHAIVFTGLVSIVASSRCLAFARPTVPLFASRRVNYTPHHRPDDKKGRIGWGHFLSVPMLLLAWWMAKYLSGQLTVFATSDQAYKQAYMILHKRLGILPEWYVGLKVVFFLAFLLWICRQIFGYLTLQRREPSVAAMHLRSELWKWDGSEQRMVGRQLGKQSQR